MEMIPDFLGANKKKKTEQQQLGEKKQSNRIPKIEMTFHSTKHMFKAAPFFSASYPKTPVGAIVKLPLSSRRPLLPGQNCQGLFHTPYEGG